jgi:hypothetical protein
LCQLLKSELRTITFEDPDFFENEKIWVGSFQISQEFIKRRLLEIERDRGVFQKEHPTIALEGITKGGFKMRSTLGDIFVVITLINIKNEPEERIVQLKNLRVRILEVCPNINFDLFSEKTIWL